MVSTRNDRRPAPPARRKGDASSVKPSPAPVRPPAPRSDKRELKRTRKRRRGTWAARLGFIFLLLCVATAGGLGYVFASIPLPDSEPPLSQTSFLCATDVPTDCNADNSMAQFTGGVDRVTVSYDQLPPVLIHAVISAEDREFFTHDGVDPMGVGRALWQDIRNKGVRQGGSTITQQYVKNTYLSDEDSIDRKVKEAVIAVKLEREVPKEEILLGYLNTIYFGRGAYGVGAAARVYFGKKVEDLNAAEAAYLAGLIRAPELADGNRGATDPAAEEQRVEAERRRETVLDAMVQEGYLTAEEAAAAGETPFTCNLDLGELCYVKPRRTSSNFGDVKWSQLGSDYYIEYVRKFLTTEAGFTDAEVFGGGLRIYTTFDPPAQERALNAIQDTLGREGDPQAALVAIDPNGYVRAMVGCWNPTNCQDPAQYEINKVNLATGKSGGGSGRQPGSTFKPIALAEALKQGRPLDSTIDAPGTKVFKGMNDGGDWTVSGYAGENSSGQLTLFDATRLSSNTAYAQLIIDVGVENVAELSHRMGVKSSVPEVPSIVLGTAQVSVLDMASVYSTFMDRGEHIDPSPVLRVTDAAGNVLWEPTGEKERVLTPDVADQVTWTLNSVIKSGTGKGAAISGVDTAGKTGTAQEYRDAWFAGYHCSMTTVVWMGYAETNDEMKSVHGRRVLGGSFPATIWRKYMTDSVDKNLDCAYDERPASAPKSLGGGNTTTTKSGSGGKKSTTTTAAKKPTATTTPTTKAPATTTPTTATPTTKAPATTTPTTAGGG